jgi:hypothetical protein
MPLYEYEAVNRRGEVLMRFSLPLAVEDRDDVTVRRAPLPRSLSVLSAAPNTEQRVANDVMNAYRRIEQRLGNNRDFQRRIGHSADQVKAAWGNEP